MPNPTKGESRKDFIDRCIPVVVKDGTAKDGKQGYAVCNSMFDQWGKKHASAESYRSMGTRVIPGAIRRATYQGVEHIVAPVVCLVGDVVVRPLGSAGPEFVPSDELAIAAAAWNGRPILPDHPDGSANDPDLLERWCFGHVFNARFEDGRLKADAYLNPLRAAKVGPEAVEIIRRCEAGEVIEVSVGAWVSPVYAPGRTKEGRDYDVRWRDIKPDHLAVGLGGAPGACSVEMGCGLGRAAKEAAMVKLNPIQRMLIAVGVRKAEDYGISDMELLSALESALRNVEPAFGYVMDVYSDTKTIIYCCTPDYEFVNYKRTYSIPDGGSVQALTLNDDRTQVERKTSWEPVPASDARAAQELVAACSGDKGSCDCGCSGGVVTTETVTQGDGHAAHAEMKGEDMADIKALVDRLLSAKRSPFDASDRPTLMGLSEQKLQSLTALAEANPDPNAPSQPAQPAGPVTTPEPERKPDTTIVVPAPDPVPDEPAQTRQARTAEQWFQDAPPEVRALADHYRAVEQQERQNLTAQIIRASDGAMTAEKLARKSTEDLRDLSAALKITLPPVDYTGRGIPVAARSEQDVANLTPPSAYAADTARRRAAMGR